MFSQSPILCLITVGVLSFFLIMSFTSFYLLKCFLEVLCLRVKYPSICHGQSVNLWSVVVSSVVFMQPVKPGRFCFRFNDLGSVIYPGCLNHTFVQFYCCLAAPPGGKWQYLQHIQLCLSWPLWFCTAGCIKWFSCRDAPNNQILL